MQAVKQPRMTKAWALFTPEGWVIFRTIRRCRAQTLDWVRRDSSWERLRKEGFYIAKVEIREASPALEGDGT